MKNLLFGNDILQFKYQNKPLLSLEILTAKNYTFATWLGY
jgi:hypothetical protein